MFVEVTRLLIVLVATAAGFSLGSAAHLTDAVLGAALGAGTGYVAGGLLGRMANVALSRAEEKLARRSPGRVLVGSFGALVGGALAALGTLPIGVLVPRPYGWGIYALATWIGAWLGARLAASRAEELLGRLGLALMPQPELTKPQPGVSILDTSVIMDGRLLALSRVGFLRGPILVPRFVLDEIQSIADSAEPTRRRRAHRGLELLGALRRDSRLELRVIQDELPEIEEVDAKLVALSRRLGATLITADTPLRRVAELQDVSCLHLGDLAAGLRGPHVPGETVAVEICKKGSEADQGVGYLEDGTMVVVGNAAELVGQEVKATLTSNVQTSQGRLLFATLACSQ